jgi:cysteine-rich repeat protein
MFRWSATCGDGVPDVGEACDASAETAACDADCTAVQCGDGVRNVTAGELCDSIVDTPGCDSDCTANTCGDGYWNVETEQCDDGGTAPGDGCSATCTNE